MRRRLLQISLAGLFVWIPFGSVPAWPQGARNADLARLATTGTLRGSNQNRARDSMVELAEQLQALYDIGGASEGPDDDVVEEIRDRSEDLAEAAGTLLEFVTQIRGGSEDDAPRVPDESYDRRTLRMVNAYLDMLEPLREFVNGEALEGEALDQLRSGLATIEALTLLLPETDF